MIWNRINRRSSFLLSLALAAALVGCGGGEVPAPAAPETVRDTPVVTVERTTVPDILEAVGTVRAARTSQLASQLLANIFEMRASEGARVQKGQVLVVLDGAQPRAALERATAALTAAQQEVVAAEANYELASATLRRYQSLYEKKSVSPQEFDQVQTRHRAATAHRDLARAGQGQAQASLAQARTVFEYTRIRAPYDGLVTEKRADPGTLAAPGTVILVVEDTRRFRLEVSVDESEISVVHLRQEVSVVIDALGAIELRGRVVQIVPTADPASRSFLVKVELAGEARLRSGLFGRAHFVRGEREALLVPQSALIRRGQLQGVYIVGPDNLLNLRYVTLGKESGEQVEVLSGLEDGERIVARPGNRELGGKRIEVRRP